MPANIAEINGRPAMAYLGQTPWHNLGQLITGERADVNAALDAAQLRWKVGLTPLLFKTPTGEVKHATNRQVVVRDIDGAYIGNVGMQYTPVQNDEAAGILETACTEFGMTIETAGALGNGEQVWMLGKLADRLEPVAGDFVDPYVLVMWGHDGATPLTGRPTTIRAVCQNTIDMALAERDAVIRLTHVRSAPARLQAASQLINEALGTMKQTERQFKKLASTPFLKPEATKFFEDMLGIDSDGEVKPAAARKRDRLIELYQTGMGAEFAPETAWAALNAVTEYVDHDRINDANNPKQLKSASMSAIFGGNAVLKARAFSTLMRRVA